MGLSCCQTRFFNLLSLYYIVSKEHLFFFFFPLPDCRKSLLCFHLIPRLAFHIPYLSLGDFGASKLLPLPLFVLMHGVNSHIGLDAETHSELDAVGQRRL